MIPSPWAISRSSVLQLPGKAGLGVELLSIDLPESGQAVCMACGCARSYSVVVTVATESQAARLRGAGFGRNLVPCSASGAYRSRGRHLSGGGFSGGAEGIRRRPANRTDVRRLRPLMFVPADCTDPLLLSRFSHVSRPPQGLQPKTRSTLQPPERRRGDHATSKNFSRGTPHTGHFSGASPSTVFPHTGHR